MENSPKVYFNTRLKQASFRREDGAHPVDSVGLHDAIAARAYAFYEARGFQHGLDMKDWLDAEREILSHNHST